MVDCRNDAHVQVNSAPQIRHQNIALTYVEVGYGNMFIVLVPGGFRRSFGSSRTWRGVAMLHV